MTEKLLYNNIYKNIFNDQELDLLYKKIDINQKENTVIVNQYAQKVWFVDIPNEIKDKVTKLAQQVYGQNVKLEEIAFARYSKEYGEFPNLTPHYDNTFLEQRVTIDIQLNANILWPIVVEEKEFVLNNNEALTFSGTHQIHWRKNTLFNDDSFIEMLFCHFSLENKIAITLLDKIEIEKQMSRYSNAFAMGLAKELYYCQKGVNNE